MAAKTKKPTIQIQTTVGTCQFDPARPAVWRLTWKSRRKLLGKWTVFEHDANFSGTLTALNGHIHRGLLTWEELNGDEDDMRLDGVTAKFDYHTE